MQGFSMEQLIDRKGFEKLLIGTAKEWIME